MKNLTLALVTSASMAIFVACDRQQSSTAEPRDKPARQVDREPDHDQEGDEHAGHEHEGAAHDDHADNDGHGHAGERHTLGRKTIGDYAVEVTQFGVARPDLAEFVFEIALQGPGTPAAVRVLVKTPDGSESLKVKANKVGEGKYDAHVGELPPTLPPGSQVLIEIQAADGGKTSAGFDLEQ